MPPPPSNFRPGVTFDGRTPSEIRTPPLEQMPSSEYETRLREMGYPIPDDMTVVLAEMEMVEHENFWQRDPQTIEGHTEGFGEAYTAPSKRWRYRFKVVPKSVRQDEDIALLMQEAREAVPPSRPARGVDGTRTKVVDLADFQIGGTDERGGTAETLARSEAALAAVIVDLIETPVDEIVLVDGGDSTEGFESAPNAAQSSDLDQTEQIRVWRRIFWRWISGLAPLAPRMVVIGVPSNHCRVRRGRNAQGKPNDDWGIEVVAQVADMASMNPQAFGHVQFIVPNEYEEHVLFKLVGGKVLGVVHGHQKSTPAALPEWIKSTGRRGLAQADIVLAHHFHHLVIQAFGDLQWMFICPTNDNGSSWFTPSSGERSDPGILTTRVDDSGWYDLDVIWLGELEG